MYLQTVEDLDLCIAPDTSRLLAGIARFLSGEGIHSYLVGGFVRDTFLGRTTADIDIAVAAGAPDVARRVAGMLDGRFVLLDEENGIGRVVLSGDDAGLYLDFSTLRGDIENDLSLRDFTIDAMAIELGENIAEIISPDSVIDPFGGRTDLRRGLVKAVADNVFQADAVRLLRAVRIAAELDFDIYVDTETLISRDSRLITGVAGERIREELLRILSLPDAGVRLAYLDRLGLLTALIPELNPARGVDQPYLHFWDVFDHSMQTVTAVEFLLREHDLEYAGDDVLSLAPWSDDLAIHFNAAVAFGSTRRSLLKLAALLHDIAKPGTRTVDDNGRTRFLGHSQEGASIAADILERLRFGNKEIKYVELLVTHHMRPTQMSHEGMPSRRALYRFFRDTGESYIDVLFLCLADHLAARGPGLDPAEWRKHTALTDYVLNAYREQETLAAPPRLVDGHDLIREFGLAPGPEIGKILEAIREARAAGEITTRRQAIGYIKNLLADRPPAGPDSITRKER